MKSGCCPRCTVRWRNLAFGLVVSWLAATSRGDTQFIPDRPWDMKHIRADLRVDLEARKVEATATLDLQAIRAASDIELDAVDLAVREVTCTHGDSKPLPAKFELSSDRLKVAAGGAPIPAGQGVRLTVTYSVADPKDGLHFFAPCEGDPSIPLQVWSQGQSIDTRRWIPCFDDPGEFQTSELIVTAPAGNEVLSNGRLVDRKEGGDGTVTFHWLQDKPHASYLITLVVGRFSIVREEWRGKPVLFYVPPGREVQAGNAFGRTRAMLDLFSARTGVEYPWDKYAQVCAEQFGGGMENTSATTLGTSVLHDDRAHLDTEVDDLISHELAHQWFGDLVTCRSWSHVWLNEGFASLFEAVWAEHDGGRDAMQLVLHRFREQALVGAGESPVVDRDYKNPNDMFDARVYQKAGFMLHVLRRKMGEEAFWRGVNAYLTRFRHQPVETHDFRRVMEAEYGGSLERFFYDWTERDDQPRVVIAYSWDSAAGEVTLDVKQKQDGDPFELPLEVEFELEGGKLERDSGVVDQHSESLKFRVSGEPRRVSVDPEQVLFADVKIEMPKVLWAAELAEGASVSGRIRAARELGESKEPDDVAVLAAQLAGRPFHAVGAAIAEQLSKADSPEARGALMLGLESTDPRIRRACAARLGKVGEDEAVTARLAKLIASGDASYQVEAAAIESWAQRHPPDALPVLLSLLSRDSQDEVIRRAVFRGLSDQSDAAALEPLLEWSARGKSSACRRAAVQALARYVEKQKPEESLRDRIVAHLTPFLSGESDRFLGGVISALSEVGKPAAPALPRLKEIAASHASEHVRRAAEKAVAEIAPKEDPKRDQKKKSHHPVARKRHQEPAPSVDAAGATPGQAPTEPGASRNGRKRAPRKTSQDAQKTEQALQDAEEENAADDDP